MRRLIRSVAVEVQTFVSAQEFLDFEFSDRDACMIVDIKMQGMSGLELLERAREISPDTRSVLITAFGSPRVEEWARHLADAYLPKPFLLRDAIRTVQRLLGEPVPPQGAAN